MNEFRYFFELNKQYFLDEEKSRLYTILKPSYRFAVVTWGICLIFNAVYIIPSSSSSIFVRPWGGTLSFVFGIIMVFGFWLIPLVRRFRLRMVDPGSATVSVLVTSNHLIVNVSGTRKVVSNWYELKKITKTPKGIFLSFHNKSNFFLPEKLFKSKKEKDKFIKFILASKIQAK